MSWNKYYINWKLLKNDFLCTIIVSKSQKQNILKVMHLGNQIWKTKTSPSPSPLENKVWTLKIPNLSNSISFCFDTHVSNLLCKSVADLRGRKGIFETWRGEFREKFPPPPLLEKNLRRGEDFSLNNKKASISQKKMTLNFFYLQNSKFRFIYISLTEVELVFYSEMSSLHDFIFQGRKIIAGFARFIGHFWGPKKNVPPPRKFF